MYTLKDSHTVRVTKMISVETYNLLKSLGYKIIFIC